MDTQNPDFSIIERTWELRLRERGLTPTPIGTGIATGHNRLELYRQETQVVKFHLDEPPGHGFFGSLEVKVVLAPPLLGEFELSDRITQRGPSLEGALAACANTFMDVTFPPLEALFTGRLPDGPGTAMLTLTSFTTGRDRAIKWDGLLGQLQTLNDPDGKARERLKTTPPITLMLDTLTAYLAEPRLHWCKLYGGNTPAAGLVFGCAIDGQKSAQGEAEMASKFGDGLPGDWEFRQFLVLRPAGDADPATTADLRARTAEGFPQPRKGFWSRLFGG